MARQRASEGRLTRRPATSPETRELELSDAAYTLAEEQLRNGSASSQVITHFLKAGSMRERLEQQRIEHEIELSRVKMENLQAQTRVEELYLGAIEAMRGYSGHDVIEGEFVEEP